MKPNLVHFGVDFPFSFFPPCPRAQPKGDRKVNTINPRTRTLLLNLPSLLLGWFLILLKFKIKWTTVTWVFRQRWRQLQWPFTADTVEAQATVADAPWSGRWRISCPEPIASSWSMSSPKSPVSPLHVNSLVS